MRTPLSLFRVLVDPKAAFSALLRASAEHGQRRHATGEQPKLKGKSRILLPWALIILIWVFAPDGVNAQRAEFLSLDSEGSSSVYTDLQRATALLLDGGRKGSLVRPRLDGKPVLAALLDRGMKHLVITCSHPHDDHAAGLLEIIDKDSNVTKFESVVFVDSDYP